jgi:hypothetical protein
MPTEFEVMVDKAITGNIHDKRKLAYFCLSHSKYVMALEWFRRMGEEGDVDSLYRAAMLYYEGKGCGAPNIQKATELLERAASYHHPEATLLLDTIHRVALTQIVPANTVEPRSSQNPLSFRDVAFKKNANSEYVAEVISPDNFSHTDEGYEEPTSQKDESYKWDAGLYENIKLKIIEPDFEQDPNSALESFVGLDSVKNCLKAIRAKALFEVKRQEAGLLQALPSHHFIFSGNPGTGKSEVARLMGHIFLNAGLLKKGHVVEIDRSNLVGGWIGHTALKTQAVINKAIGGVLFIDEAYSLFDESPHDNGDEAISTLLKNMEDKRGEFIVIMAGYQNKMQKLIESNPGLKSRFRHHIHFADFTSNELVSILRNSVVIFATSYQLRHVFE